MASFGKVPTGNKLDVKPFRADIDEQKISDLKQLLKLSPIAPANFENSRNGRRYGVERDWLIKAKEYWLNSFDWRKTEAHINSFPNFTATVKDDKGYDINIHFIALFSQRADAVPVAFFHGWPGSILEFLGILDILTKRYTPETLPFNVIVPSLPGYAYSGSPTLEYDFALENASETMNNLMIGLGYESGYLAQGGDLGSFVSKHLTANCAACKGSHVNFSPMGRPKNAEELPLDPIERESLSRGLWFVEEASSYAWQHGSRTATIGFALSASPLALLSWIGEKFLDWTDEDPSLDQILESVTLYWLTDTFPRCIYPYRGNTGGEERPRIATKSGRGRDRPYLEKPCGYSFFPKELLPMPRSWVGSNCNLVHSNLHTSGGHFAAMEKPAELLSDFEEYVAKAWKGQAGKL